ncbi:MAG: DUF3987 domain-containing protein [Candidatus Liptonbacteria bacterium]|nr:DUF3987 domain-containing protein [Candidatus Liptonbacteria bacterium]
MKKILAVAIGLSFFSGILVHAQSTSTTSTSQGIGSDVSAANKEAEAQIKALRDEYNTKIKAIQEAAKIRIKNIQEAKKQMPAKIKENMPKVDGVKPPKPKDGANKPQKPMPAKRPLLPKATTTVQ